MRILHKILNTVLHQDHCEYCGHYVDRRYGNYCEHCGQYLPQLVCTNCGTVLHSGKYCYRCGGKSAWK